MKSLFKNHSKLLAALLALVMTISIIGGAALAADPALSLVQVSETQYTTFLSTPGDQTTLYATQTTDYEDNQPFKSEGDADAVTWGWTNDGSTIYSTKDTGDGQLTISKTGHIDTGAGYTGPTPDYAPAYAGWYACAKIEINAAAVKPAVYSPQAQLSSGAPINFTIAIQSTAGMPDATDIYVRLVDNTQSPAAILYTNTAALSVAHPISGDVIYGKSSALQNDPSAMGILQTLTNDGVLDDDYQVDAPGAYVSEIDINGNEYAQTGSPTYYGWQYGVYRDDGTGTYILVQISSVVSASAFPLQSGDRIIWQYGSYSSLPPSW
jgi:hypothetical protein